MIDIKNHPVWRSVNPIKKRGHLLRISLARQYAKYLDPAKFIGISGSVGKTTTTEAALAVLSKKFKTIATVSNLDTIFNLPITILKVRPKIERVILELGVEYPGEMEFYLHLVRPQTAIITGVSRQHSQFLGDVEDIAKEKSKLITQLPKKGVAILNYDDTSTRKMAEQTEAQVYFYGMDSKNCHVWASDLRIESFQLVFGLHHGVERVEVRSRFIGYHQVYPLMAAATLGISQGIALTKIKSALEGVEPPIHRLQPIPGHNGSIILDDTYNAAPISVEEALETLSRVPARRRIVVLGEMKELGHFSEESHRRVARKVYQEKPDLVFLGSGDAKYIADELIKLGFLPERMEVNMKNPQIVAALLQVLAKGDVVLVKGAHSVRLDEVVEKISKP